MTMAAASTNPSSTTTTTAAPPQQQQQLPPTFARLVADAPADSFRAAARVDGAAPLPLPSSLAPGEVLVRMHYAGINGGCETFRARAEHAFARHREQHEPYPLGAEGSGVVVARAAEGVPASLPLGQPVAVNGASAFAEYAVAKATMCTPVPEASAAATAITLSGLTAAAALADRVPRGGTVVVTAAAGGAGHFALQYARLYGAGRIVAVVGSERKAKWLRDEFWPEVVRRGTTRRDGGEAAAEKEEAALPGTDELVIVDCSQYLGARGAAPARATGQEQREQALAEALRRACGGGGADVIFEGVGGSVGRVCLQALAPGGIALQVGYISEYPHTTTQSGGGDDVAAAAGDASASASSAAAPPPPSNAELFWKGLERDLGEGRRVTGSVWPRDPRAIGRAKRRVFADHYERGVLVAAVSEGVVEEGGCGGGGGSGNGGAPPATAHLRGVAAIPDAIDQMLRGEHVGKFVVRIV